MASEIFSWIDTNGTEHVFDGTYYKVLMGIEGRFMPPFRFIEDEVPMQPGNRLRLVKTQAREVDLPLLIRGTTDIELRTKVRALMNAINPSLGDGRLRVWTPIVECRELFCRYLSGMELTEGTDSHGLTWQKVILIFRAQDPYWYDLNPTIYTFTTGTPATFFPFFPLRLSSSTVFADTTIPNNGDVECWPEWIITGPGSSIVLRNLTTGEGLTINATLTTGETITIDTRPGIKTVTKNDGTNLYGLLGSNPILWSLQKGSTSVRIEMSGATSDSSVQLTQKNRYLGV